MTKPPSMGQRGKDKITGFTGIVTGRSEYINGCVHLMLEATAKPGQKPVHSWFDEERCVATNIDGTTRTTRKRIAPRTHRPGGPMPHSR